MLSQQKTVEKCHFTANLVRVSTKNCQAGNSRQQTITINSLKTMEWVLPILGTQCFH